MRRDPLSCHHRRGLVLAENIRGTGASENLSHKIPKYGRFNYMLIIYVARFGPLRSTGVPAIIHK